MEKEIERVKNIMKMERYYLKENIKKEKGMEKGKNIIKMVKYYLMENTLKEECGME